MTVNELIIKKFVELGNRSLCNYNKEIHIFRDFLNHENDVAKKEIR